MPLRVHVAWLTAIALSSVLALVVLAQEFGQEFRPERAEALPTVALRFDLDAVVDIDGTMRVEERFRYAFDRERVQLKRFFPATETLPTDWEVLRDDEPEPFTLVSQGDGHLLVVGEDGGSEGDGVHEYVFRYRVAPVLAGAPQTAQLFGAQLVSPRYGVPVRAGRVQVRFPSRTRTAACYFGDDSPCRVVGLGTDRLRIAIDAMAPRTGLFLRAGLAPTPEFGRIP